MPSLTFLGLLRASLLVQLRESFAQSTLHGVRYIAERGQPFWEKFCWFCMVSTGTVTTLVIIFNLWQRFLTNPTITGPDTGLRQNWTIFPTVAMCPMDPLDRGNAQRWLQSIEPAENFTEMEPFLRLMAKISYAQFDAIVSAMKEDVPQTWSRMVVGKSFRDFVFQVAVGCDDLLAGCWFRGEPLECCSQFLPVFSEHGFCYAFNSKFIDAPERWERSTEVNYLYETDKKWGLTFAPLQPSHIFVHSYNEISGWDFRPQVKWDVNFAIDFLISMKETYTTEDARQLSTGQRKCIFPDEVELKYYRDDYTFSGCMKECRMQKCLKYCKCIPPFYAPPVSLPFCTVKQLACLAKYTANITSISGCQNCELGCHNTVYDIEKYSKIMSTDESKEPVVTIEYLTWPIIRYKREVLFGWVDLLVSFGGIAGLFLGFSLLSGVEIIYFFTMRACCMLYKNRDELIAIEQEKLKRPQHRYDLSLRPDFGNRVHPSGTTAPSEPQPDGLVKRLNKNIITVGLIEQEFLTVKVPSGKGLVLGGASNRYIGRYERMKTIAKPDIFRPILVAPYSEKIKPLDRNVIGNKDGLFYNGYLP
ncbi:sodium channel protein Nach-like [Ochlerotatus camptorhynchus]|uniref:sodium channel protein Nach-like n=1 Tax=Ochlerotatus camptorhynchus TaxID=644619 RepID=UPI0031CFD02D